MLKVGMTFQQRGKWNGVQIIPGAFVDMLGEKLPITRARMNDMVNLWHHDILNRVGGFLAPRYFYSAGADGQYIVVVPEKQLVCVCTGNNNDVIAASFHKRCFQDVAPLV